MLSFVPAALACLGPDLRSSSSFCLSVSGCLQLRWENEDIFCVFSALEIKRNHKWFYICI